MSEPTKNPVQQARSALIYAIGATLFLMLIPRVFPSLSWVIWPQVLLTTLVHELGHGAAALLTGGGFESFKLYANGSGVALTVSSGGALQRAMIAAGGPLAPPLLASILFVTARFSYITQWVWTIVCVMLCVALFLWARNVFAWSWLGFCAVVAGAAAWKLRGVALQTFSCFIAAQLCLASLSQTAALFSSAAQTGAGEFASDTMQVAMVLGGPVWFWGVMMALISLMVLIFGLAVFAYSVRSVNSLTSSVLTSSMGSN